MKANENISKKMSMEQIKDIVFESLTSGDKIHVTKKSRSPINDALATFKGAYNHFLCIEAYVNNSCLQNFTISYSELFTGETIIHELSDKFDSFEASLNNL